jgi:flagellar biosynthetic protein FliP
MIMTIKKQFKIICFVFVFAAALTAFRAPAYASSTNPLFPEVSVSIGGTDDPADVVPALQVLFLVSIIALAPSILVLLTGFTRIVIAMHFVRSAMGTQQMPPNQVMIGISLILTIYLMAPILSDINENALQPFGNGELSIEEAISRGMAPISKFMRDQAEDQDVELFCELAGQTFETVDDVPDSIIIPAFIIGELTKGFLIGFIMYLPFIVIDMVVASVLMAMGMMMLPPAMISLPFKILLFLIAGGWSFMIEYIMRTFRVT